MEELIRNKLENEEQLLWTGKSVSKKIFDNTNRMGYLMRILVPLAIMAGMMYASVVKNGGIKVSAFLMLFLLGILIPMAAVLDGLGVRDLEYAATDKRLIRKNGSQLISVNYDEIAECRFGKDKDGQTSLLCGKKAVNTSPSKWRGQALFAGNLEKDEESHVKAYTFYAVNDPDGLKQAMTGKVHYKDA